MIYSELMERVVQGVVRTAPDPLPLDRIRLRAEAAFPQINIQTAEEFAASEDRRPLLRSNVVLTFTSGTAPLPDNVLKKYIKDASLIVPNSPYMAYYESHDYSRTQDRRLGKWKLDGSTITAEKATVAVTGPVTLNCISAPLVPTTASANYDAPDEMVTGVIDAMIVFLTGQ